MKEDPKTRLCAERLSQVFIQELQMRSLRSVPPLKGSAFGRLPVLSRGDVEPLDSKQQGLGVEVKLSWNKCRTACRAAFMPRKRLDGNEPTEAPIKA